VIITLLKLHNKLSCESRLSLSSCRASRVRRVERVETWGSTSSTQPKCMGSTRRTCPAETSQVEFWLYSSNILSQL